MLPYLNSDTPFPNVDKALVEPNGLLAAGADLSPERLIKAYSDGIFPWYAADEPILWWSPDPRTVFFIEQFKIKRSVLKTLRQQNLTITLNTAFDAVITACAEPRDESTGTWITDEMKQAYLALHKCGAAHSVEVWQDDKLVGGIYGVASGGVFCGESMFSRISNGSKIALSCLIGYLRPLGFKLIDCQVDNAHLETLGSCQLSRSIYLKLLNETQALPIKASSWQAQSLDWKHLLRQSPNV